MTGAAQFAFGNTRVRALKSRLWRPEDAAAMRAAAGRGAQFAYLQEVLGFEAQTPAELFVVLFSRLVADYEKVLRSYSTGSALFLALVQLHEVENLKLGWRALTHAHSVEQWVPCWRPLGRLERIRRDSWREAGSLRQAVGLLRGTPYEQIGSAVFRAHEADPPAAEMAFDRWASMRLLEAARSLPPAEHTAQTLIFQLLRERDCDMLFRGRLSYGMSTDLAIGSTVILPAEVRRTELQLFAGWTPEAGALAPLVPPRVLRDPAGVTDVRALRRALRIARRQSCRRAFLEQPFQLGPAVAFLLLREEEVRGVTALSEAEADSEVTEVLADVLAGSLMGG